MNIHIISCTHVGHCFTQLQQYVLSSRRCGNRSIMLYMSSAVMRRVGNHGSLSCFFSVGIVGSLWCRSLVWWHPLMLLLTGCAGARASCLPWLRWRRKRWNGSWASCATRTGRRVPPAPAPHRPSGASPASPWSMCGGGTLCGDWSTAGRRLPPRAEVASPTASPGRFFLAALSHPPPHLLTLAAPLTRLLNMVACPRLLILVACGSVGRPVAWPHTCGSVPPPQPLNTPHQSLTRVIKPELLRLRPASSSLTLAARSLVKG